MDDKEYFKERKKEQRKRYRDNNREQIKAYNKSYRLKQKGIVNTTPKEPKPVDWDNIKGKGLIKD